MYKLREYQTEAVTKTVSHFRKTKKPAVIVLPTGAGKSLVIAELARIAQGRVLVLAHVKELVEQNFDKYQSYGLKAGIYSAGLGRKETQHKVIFGSIQSVARADESMFANFSIVIIDECHRINSVGDTQYSQVIRKLKEHNPEICILGLSATPYRLDMGWIYEYSYKGIIRTQEDRFFKKCIYELSLSYMIKNKYLTPPIKIDSPVACYDFSALKKNNKGFSQTQIESTLKDQARVTPGIVKNILDMTIEGDRKGVMIFTSTVRHAREILSLLPKEESAIVTGETSTETRDEIIVSFKNRDLKYLVNVSVLTTGFDAPHVDVIAILRPTESISLYQQIIGRGLRLSPQKEDCLILDYTGQDHNLFSPEISQDKPNEESVLVDVSCPICGFVNKFWGVIAEEGYLEEHFGRKCQGASEDDLNGSVIPCGYRFRFKICEKCGSENDIAARECSACQFILVDTDSKLKEAMSLKDAHVMKPDSMSYEKSFDKNNKERLKVSYYDFDANSLSEYFYLSSPTDLKSFYLNFTRMHKKIPEDNIQINSIDDVLKLQHLFRIPAYVIGRKKKYYWQIREKIFL